MKALALFQSNSILTAELMGLGDCLVGFLLEAIDPLLESWAFVLLADTSNNEVWGIALRSADTVAISQSKHDQ
jgi:hypothetical protein